MSDLYWLSQSLSALPFAILMYGLNGLGWAFLVLPRSEWHQRATVGALAILLGGATMTAYLLMLGVLGAQLNEALLTPLWAVGGGLMLTLIGLSLAGRKWQRTQGDAHALESHSWQWDERLLIVLIGVALLVRWVVTAYWTFTAYDALWVYGSQPRLYFLTGMIPNHIDYYPQFLQLQYTFIQLGVGVIDDHAARVVVMFLQVGSILAVYTLGMRLFGRRVGIYASAIWALYPQMSAWAYVGDLEVPLTYSLTLASVFFLQAWQAQTSANRRRYALIAGTVLGIAMWTKPTAGAFIWGVMVLVIVDFVRVRFNWRKHLPRFEVAFFTGFASIPLGAIWYIRNIILGHEAIRFPHFSWLDRATRSADMFGWLLLALGLLIAYLFIMRKQKPNPWLILAGLFSLSMGIAPSLPLLNPARLNPPDSYIQGAEWALIVLGIMLIMIALWRYAQTQGLPRQFTTIGWALLLATPYFITWFYSYSYHARLSFAIVPLLLLPSAVIIAHWAAQWFVPTAIIKRISMKRISYGVFIGLMAIPGIIGTYTAPSVEIDWLWTDRYPNDHDRYQVQNPGIVLLWDYLSGYERQDNTEARIMAAGEQRLPFFFPLNQITSDVVPTSISDLDGYTHFVYGSHARWRYEDEGIVPKETQIIAGLGRQEVFEPYFTFDSGTFRYELYELHTGNRFNVSDVAEVNMADQTVLFGDWARYMGHSLSTLEFSRGFTIYITWAFEALGAAPDDYTLLIEIVRRDTGEVITSWRRKPIQHAHGYYNTRLWEAGEVVYLRDRLGYPDDLPDAPCGEYDFMMSFGREVGEVFERVPVTIDGDTQIRYPMEETFMWSPCAR